EAADHGDERRRHRAGQPGGGAAAGGRLPRGERLEEVAEPPIAQAERTRNAHVASPPQRRRLAVAGHYNEIRASFVSWWFRAPVLVSAFLAIRPSSFVPD